MPSSPTSVQHEKEQRVSPLSGTITGTLYSCNFSTGPCQMLTDVTSNNQSIRRTSSTRHTRHVNKQVTLISSTIVRNRRIMLISSVVAANSALHRYTRAYERTNTRIVKTVALARTGEIMWRREVLTKSAQVRLQPYNPESLVNGIVFKRNSLGVNTANIVRSPCTTAIRLNNPSYSKRTRTNTPKFDAQSHLTFSRTARGVKAVKEHGL